MRVARDWNVRKSVADVLYVLLAGAFLGGQWRTASAQPPPAPIESAPVPISSPEHIKSHAALGALPVEPGYRPLLPGTYDERLTPELEVNPVLRMRYTLDPDALQRSWNCVDPEGTFTCGVFSGQNNALTYATIIGSVDRIRSLSTKEILAKQGDPAVAAAAAIGDLDSIRMLIAAGAAHGLLKEDHLGSYPLFRARAEGAAHPAYVAAEFGHSDVVAFFVDRGLSVSTKFDAGISDLFTTALFNHRLSVLDYVLHNGYKIDCAYRFPSGADFAGLAEHNGFPEGAALIRSQCH